MYVIVDRSGYDYVTSTKIRKNTDDVLKDIIGSGLEHHMALTYGDHTKTLKEVASVLKLPVLEI